MLRSLFRKKLLAWYRKNARDLPWRRTADPYRIWVSEIMLAQTRVQTAIPYYERFIKHFPSVVALAEADEPPVLKAWEGLGYYSRARNLQQAAREVMERYGGKLPRTSGELAKLPGFGPYTSAAVGSIAFGEPVAVVDGNVRRVISRLLEQSEGMGETAQGLLDPASPGDFNQAMMELGALICLPKKPRCQDCPVAAHCSARKNGTIGRYPPARFKPKVERIWAATLLIRFRSRWLLIQRPPKGRWGGMWEFPTVEHRSPISPAAALKEFARMFNLKVPNVKTVGHFRHQLSHQDIRISVLRGEAARSVCPANGMWATGAEVSGLALSRLQRKAFDLI